MKLTENWRELITVDFPPLRPITEKTRLYTIENAHRFRGSVITSLGKFPTDSEYEKRCDEIRNKPLP